MNNPFEEFEKQDNLELTESTTVLQKLDEFEENLRQLEILQKQEKKLKAEIKEQMLKAGKVHNLEQIKWTTPKGIKITCSIGKPAEFEKRIEKKFNIEKLMKDYPEIYENCSEEKEVSVCIKNASNDRLVITLPKEA